MTDGGPPFALGGVVVAIVFGLIGLWQVGERLANPSAPGATGTLQLAAKPELRAAVPHDPAQPTAAELAAFRNGCTSRRKLNTNVGNGWQMYDAEATAEACDCAVRVLSRQSGRIEWLSYVYAERGESGNLAAVEARLERLGNTAEQRRAIVKAWRTRREEVHRSCRR